MSRRIYIDELVKVWFRTEYEIPDTLTDEEIKEFLKNHEPYEFEELDVKNINDEFLGETAETLGVAEAYDKYDHCRLICRV